MKIIVFIYFLFGSSLFLNTQQNGVEIIEDIGKKRISLFAKNTTNEPRSVFLKVDATGYRRSSDRPIIKLVPPNSKALMVTLIPLTDVESKYTYTFVANNQLENLSLDHGDESQKEANVADIMQNEVVIFTISDCKKCHVLINKLKSNHVKYREINIDQRDRFYKYTWQLLKEKGYKTNSLLLPLASVNGTIVHPIDNIELFSRSFAK